MPIAVNQQLSAADYTGGASTGWGKEKLFLFEGVGNYKKKFVDVMT